MKKYINICSIYILLWFVYYLQGIVYAEGSAISQMILLIIMCISAFYFVYVNRKWKVPPFMRVLNLFIAVMTIYGVALMLDPQPVYLGFVISETLSKLEFLKMLYISFLPIYVMYYCTQKGMLSLSMIQVITFLLLVSTTLSYFREQNELIQQALDRGLQQEEFTNNLGYEFLALFPLLFFFSRRPLIQFLLGAYICVFIVLGLKRGAIIIGIVCLMWFICRIYKSAHTAKHKSIISLLTVLTFVIGVKFIVDFYATSDYFQHRLESTLMGESSGRDTIFYALWNHITQDPSIVHLFFGNGALAAARIVGNYAHNDWLELAIGQGLLGVVIYAFYYITLFQEFMRSKRDTLRHNILGMLFLIMFATSLFSMSYNSLGLSLTICLGYCLARNSPRWNN